MSNISNYSENTTVENPVSYAKIGDNTKKVQEFVKYLHEMMPVLQKEFDELEARYAIKPNDIFPIKMKALSAVWKAAGPLYEWYVEKAKKQA